MDLGCQQHVMSKALRCLKVMDLRQRQDVACEELAHATEEPLCRDSGLRDYLEAPGSKP